MLEYQINNFINLKLEKGKKGDYHTQIYINGKLFKQCKSLLLVNLQYQSRQLEINSIDDAIKLLKENRENETILSKIDISPEEEFKAHCSNLQVWLCSNENKYPSQKHLRYFLIMCYSKKNYLI